MSQLAIKVKVETHPVLVRALLALCRLRLVHPATALRVYQWILSRSVWVQFGSRWRRV